MKMGDYPHALKDCEKALQLSPTFGAFLNPDFVSSHFRAVSDSEFVVATKFVTSEA